MEPRSRFICPSCNKPIRAVTTYLRSKRPSARCSCTGEIVNGEGRYAGCTARYMPPVNLIPSENRPLDYLPTGTDLSDGLPFSEHANAARARRSTNGYSVVILQADDAQEIRVRQAVRDFGLLADRRDIAYAASVGMDWQEFTTGVVEPETDTLSAEGAYLSNVIPTVRAKRPADLSSVKRWRKATGRSGGVSERSLSRR